MRGDAKTLRPPSWPPGTIVGKRAVPGLLGGTMKIKNVLCGCGLGFPPLYYFQMLSKSITAFTTPSACWATVSKASSIRLSGKTWVKKSLLGTWPKAKAVSAGLHTAYLPADISEGKLGTAHAVDVEAHERLRRDPYDNQCAAGVRIS